MKDLRFQKRLENAVDTTLASLDPSARECNQIIGKAMEGRNVKKIHFTAKPIFIFVIILLLMTASALAAGIIFAKRVPATEIADRALLKTYGITAQMQSMFIRETAEGEGGTTVVTYEGKEHLAYVLGKYTVIVDGQTVKSISWSHDGEDMSGGLEASAWGKDQLEEILRIDPETGEQAQLLVFDPYVERINREHGFDYQAYWNEKEDEKNVVVLEGEDIEKAKEKQAFSAHDFVQIAKEAVGVRYHLTSRQISLMSINVDENWAYVLLDGTLCYCCQIFVGELSDEETEQDGTYTVYLNLETGVVEDILFLSEHGGGNG
ncbi:MAG: hypothetical protein J5472_02955 [Clostridia bacterium]|nr:hypothetical protein [Clostridia bacterium]